MEEEFQEEEDYFLSEEQKWGIIISIKHFNLTYEEIAEEFNIGSKGTVSKVYHKYLLQNDVQNNHHNKGRSTKRDDSMHECIDQVIETIGQKHYSSKDIQSQLSNQHKIHVSTPTVINCLKTLGLKYGRIKYCHELTQVNKDQRVEVGKQMLIMNFERIVFSDESLFQINENSLQIWHRESTDLLQPKKELSYKNKQLMVWGAVSMEGKCELYIHDTTVDSSAYITCLEKSLLPMIKAFYGRKKYVLFQDGARCHTSKQTLEWCQNKKIQIFQNAPWSPDTNPIELVWASMKRVFKKINYSSNIQNRDQLKEIILQIWQELDQQFINRCIQHVKDILPKIIKLNGDYLY
ncbi:hypothetical protein ABPG72_020088 [Tetrahymena utriculariae]